MDVIAQLTDGLFIKSGSDGTARRKNEIAQTLSGGQRSVNLSLQRFDIILSD